MSARSIPAAYWITGIALLAAALGYQMGLADREGATREQGKAGAMAPQFERG